MVAVVTGPPAPTPAMLGREDSCRSLSIEFLCFGFEDRPEEDPETELEEPSLYPPVSSGMRFGRLSGEIASFKFSWNLAGALPSVEAGPATGAVSSALSGGDVSVGYAGPAEAGMNGEAIGSCEPEEGVAIG